MSQIYVIFFLGCMPAHRPAFFMASFLLFFSAARTNDRLMSPSSKVSRLKYTGAISYIKLAPRLASLFFFNAKGWSVIAS